jgi:hypothetical protein
MGGDEVVNDKMLGYFFILTGDGYPIFWWDYFNLRTCATPYAEWNGCAD